MDRKQTRRPIDHGAQCGDRSCAPLPRREFIKQGATLAVLSSSILLSTSMAAAPADNHPIGVALFDERYSDSREFAAALTQFGAQRMCTSGDLGQLWYGQLRGRFAQQRGLRVAGMTTHSDLTLMQAFALEAGARVLFQACHDCRGSTHLTHTIYGSMATQNELLRAAASWPLSLAQIAALRSGQNDLSVMTQVRTPRSPDHPGTLWSWMVG